MNFWDRIRSALEPSSALPDDVERQLRMATGALLLEMCRADFKVTAEERNSIALAIRDAFELSAEETRLLMEQAETQSECAVSLQIYTSLIKEYANTQRKLALIEDMWRVAWADGELHDLELRLVHRVAELLELAPKTVEKARRRIESAMNEGTFSNASTQAST